MATIAHTASASAIGSATEMRSERIDPSIVGKITAGHDGPSQVWESAPVPIPPKKTDSTPTANIAHSRPHPAGGCSSQDANG